MAEPVYAFSLLLVLAFPLMFGVIWVGVCYMMASVGGWSRLAAAYPAPERFAGPWTSATGLVGSARYKGGALRVGADERGLWLDVPGVMRPGHRPLHVPWADLQEQEGQVFRGVQLTALVPRLAPEVRVQVPASLLPDLRRGR